MFQQKMALNLTNQARSICDLWKLFNVDVQGKMLDLDDRQFHNGAVKHARERGDARSLEVDMEGILGGQVFFPEVQSDEGCCWRQLDRGRCARRDPGVEGYGQQDDKELEHVRRRNYVYR